MNYERRQAYRGPEKFVSLPTDMTQAEDIIDDTLLEHPDNGDVMSAVVLEASQNWSRRYAKAGKSSKSAVTALSRPNRACRKSRPPTSGFAGVRSSG